MRRTVTRGGKEGWILAARIRSLRKGPLVGRATLNVFLGARGEKQDSECVVTWGEDLLLRKGKRKQPGAKT